MQATIAGDSGRLAGGLQTFDDQFAVGLGCPEESAAGDSASGGGHPVV